MRNGLILAFSHFDTGGLQTLMVRMAEWCKCNSVKCIIIYKTVDERMEELCSQKGIEAVRGPDRRAIKRILSGFLSSVDETMLMTFELPEFMYFEELRGRYFLGHRIRHIIYNVSVGSMIYGRTISGRSGKYIYKLYKRICQKLYDNRQVLFMDDDTCASMQRYYGFHYENYRDNIVLLPMFISPEPDFGSGTKDKTILTVSRAAFPYKGYLLGLIDDFAQLATEDRETKLNIVSFGPDLPRLTAKINALDEDVQKRVRLVPGMSLEEIRGELKKTHLYIGMGTTVLDAVDEAVPSIVVCHTTEKNICLGMFHENPRVTSALGEGAEGVDSVSLIRKVCDCSEDEYVRLRRETYEAFKENYDINRIMARFMAQEPVAALCVDHSEFVVQRILFVARHIRRTILDFGLRTGVV